MKKQNADRKKITYEKLSKILDELRAVAMEGSDQGADEGYEDEHEYILGCLNVMINK